MKPVPLPNKKEPFLIYNLQNLANIFSLHVEIINDFQVLQPNFDFASFSRNMDMSWQMLVRVKEEPKTIFP